MLEWAADAVAAVGTELLVFAGIGFLVGGASDVLIDLIWIGRALWRRLTVYRRHPRATAATFSPSKNKRIAIFVPAWDEAVVIEAMLRHAVATLGTGDWRIYVGTYPNDPATATAARHVDHPGLHIVEGTRPGPTTKADCLNTLWRQLIVNEEDDGWRADAVVLHDAEDVVHPDEMAIYNHLTDRFDLIQLPVVPLIDQTSRWISGHYNDEFAESHGRTIVVREALGAGIPAAGVGCAFSRAMLDRIAATAAEGPFDSSSLTEDYELGLRIRQMGGTVAFVRIPAGANRPVVAVRAHFPASIDAAVRQKARWIVGIALTGWDRLGWSGTLAERWMRLHDRRALVSAVVLLAAYVGVILTTLLAIGTYLGVARPRPVAPLIGQLLLASSLLLAWRLGLRVLLVTQIYGWREGLRSIPRSIVANGIAIMATYRAVVLYLRLRRNGRIEWDKTAHQFPTMPAA